MACKCPLACYIAFVLISLMLYLAEIIFHVAAAIHMYQDGNTVWFALLVGLLAVPTFTVQLMSYQWYGKGSDCVHQVTVALLHTILLGIPWRYGRLIVSNKVTRIDKEISEASSLRVVLAFTSSLPMIVVEAYNVLNAPSLLDHVLVMTASLVAIISVCWTCVTYRKRPNDYSYLVAIMSWPGTVLKLIWRIGEIGSRVLVLGLFAGLHHFWLFLVLTLHWITMLMWLIVDHMLRPGSKDKCKSFPYVLISSYMYIFSYLNVLDRKAKYRSVIFYCIMCFENAVLLILWIIYDDRVNLHIPVAVIMGSSFAISLIMAVVYYNCFHLKAFPTVKMDQHTAYIHTCINCRLSCCVKHELKMQRPYQTEWWNQPKQRHLADKHASEAPSDISSASKPRMPPCAGQYVNPAFAHRQYNSYLDDTFSTVYTDSQYLSEFTVDSHYDTGSEFIWDNYDLKHRSAPDLIDATSTPNAPETAPIHQRSDSGFSASLSVQSDSRPHYTDNSIYTTDDSDFSYDPRYHRYHVRAHWRRMSAEALNEMSKIFYRSRFEDPSESDFYSQSSVTSYPSSVPQRRPKMYRDRKKLAMARYSSGVARTLQKRAERSRLSTAASDSDTTVTVPDRLSPRAIPSPDSPSASDSALSCRARVAPPKPPRKFVHKSAKKELSQANQDALDRIIADVSKIEISLSDPTPQPPVKKTAPPKPKRQTPVLKARTLGNPGGDTVSTDQSVLSDTDSPSTNSTATLVNNIQKQKTQPVWF